MARPARNGNHSGESNEHKSTPGSRFHDVVLGKGVSQITKCKKEKNIYIKYKLHAVISMKIQQTANVASQRTRKLPGLMGNNGGRAGWVTTEDGPDG